MSDETKGDVKRQTWFVRIDRWQPTRLNQLLNASHWSERRRLKHTDEQFIALGCLGADVEPAECKRRVSLEITLAPGQRAADPDAYWKSVLDGLVKCRALKNDSHVWCELGEVKYRRGKEQATAIILENLHKDEKSQSVNEQAQAKPVARFTPA